MRCKWWWAGCAWALAWGCNNENTFSEQTQRDTFAQAPNNEVDILWVIDDSNSMRPYQEIVASGVDVFAQNIESSGTVFHLGVVTTSFDDSGVGGVLMGDPPFLTKDTPNYQDVFRERALIGTGGADKEKGISAAVAAVSPTMVLPGGPNEGFLRPAAQLLVIFVSDEEDCSDNGALNGQPSDACYLQPEKLVPVELLVQQLWNVKGDRNLVNVGAIVGTGSSTCSANVQQGRRYASMANANGGLVGDICRSDWDEILGELGLNAVGIRRVFKLTKAAVPESIVVYVDDDVVDESPTNGWTYEPEAWTITFHGAAVPARGASVLVEYTVQPGVRDPALEEAE